MTQTGWLLRDGLKLAVHGGGTAGQTLVFQHGLCGDARQISEAVSGLAPQRWAALECRGHGASEVDDQLSIPIFAKDVAALIEKTGAPVVLGGISMGAAIALHLAVHRPGLVRGLILVRPAWLTDANPDTMTANAEVGRLLQNNPAGTARSLFQTSDTGINLRLRSPDNYASVLGFFDRQPLDVTARLLTSISADGPDVTMDQIRGLTVPSLICGTQEDVVHPMAYARTLAGLIPRACFAELPAKARDRAGHMSALSTAITQFLQEL